MNTHVLATPIYSANDRHTDSGENLTDISLFPALFLERLLFRGSKSISDTTVTPFFVVRKVVASENEIPNILDEIRSIAMLNEEELAALLSTSRQTLHNWRGGRKISARRERRLLKLFGALKKIDQGRADLTRTKLLEFRNGEVRVFDLLAEGQFKLAIAASNSELEARNAVVMGSIANSISDVSSVATQMNLIENGPKGSVGRLNRKYSRRL